MQNIPHSSCLGIYHENVRLLLVTLNKYVKTIPTEFRSFIELIVCDQNSEDCMLGGMLKMSNISITWWRWNSNENGRIEKQEFTGEIMDCFQRLENLYLFSEAYIHQEEAIICI